VRRARIAWKGAVHSVLVNDDLASFTLPDGRHVPEAEAVWLPPVEPRTSFALGLNYADHAAELAFKAPDKPLIFLKGPNTFLGHKGESRCPADVAQMHFECELVVVIGRAGKKIRPAHAYDHVAGYTVANDYALREYLENYYRPNLRVKNRDSSTPLGPWLVDRDDVPDPMNLDLRSRVNGELVQSGNTRDMVFDIPTLIAYISDFMTLSPGDMILTGTPQGVRYLKPSDEVVTEIDGVGRLVNRIIGE
jgi:5-oxopent-3-ene-1,2,5-tricarboxylate decarboxylase/2-hydroxyhepta-2,4-diene-1,7-dioate isomerase